MPTTLPTRAIPNQSARLALWRIVVGLMLVELSRCVFALAEWLCMAAERIAGRR